MYIRFEQAREAPVAWDETVALTAVELGVPALLECAALECHGQATAIDGGMHLSGTIVGSWRLQCERCLEAFEARLETEIDLALLENPALVAEMDSERESEEVQLEESDFATLNVVGEGVETVPLVGEQVALTVPMKPLCREECAGLCPSCGRNRNLESCDCAEREVDPRWAALAGLREGRS